MQSPQHFTLRQVADSIRKTIEQRYNRTYWVLAEMHKLNETRKGHCYPELVQKEDGNIVVEMRGTIWKNAYERIRSRFMEVVNEPLRDGLELLFQVRIVYHPIYNLGLEIIDIDPNYTLGALQRERQETLERLNREGILNANQQLEMALVPKRLAIISQADSKGYSDFIILLQGHPKKYHFNTFLFEAALQGDNAIASITAQLNRIARIKQHFDAVVIIRGGGGEIGMHCYNNYTLARTIATFPLPVLTGIGHSTNMTVCEMIAYNNGITPSDLAYYLLRIFEELDEPLDEAAIMLPAVARAYLQQLHNRFETTVKNFQAETKRNLREHQVEAASTAKDFRNSVRHSLSVSRNALTNSANMLKPLSLRFIQSAENDLSGAKTTVDIYRKNLIKRENEQLGQAMRSLSLGVPHLLAKQQRAIGHFEKQLELTDPMNVLKRGYSIVTNENGVISGQNIPQKGEMLKIRYAGGELDAAAGEIIE